MKKKLSNYLVICLCLFFLYYILTHNKLISENILMAVNLWITKVFPSLFPMFIINDLLIYSEFPNLISKWLNKFTKIFKISGTCLYVFFMSIFSGAPSNAIILKELLNNNEITSDDASLTLAFTYFSNPLFLWNILTSVFNNSTTLKIILIHYLSNIIILILLRNKLSNITSNLPTIKNTKTKLSFILNNSIKKGIDTLFMILGTITFYIILSSVLINCFNFSDTTNTLLKGFLEITQGLNALTYLDISFKIKEIIAISIISFGGLSIHSQVQNIVSDTSIKYKYFLLGRIIHTFISTIIILIV